MLKPIVIPGTDQPANYATRDPIGVEANAGAPRTGVNLIGEFTERRDGAFYTEHGADGLHATLKIPDAVVFWNGYTVKGNSDREFRLHPASEVRGRTLESDPGCMWLEYISFTSFRIRFADPLRNVPIMWIPIRGRFSFWRVGEANSTWCPTSCVVTAEGSDFVEIQTYRASPIAKGWETYPVPGGVALYNVTR